MNRLVFLAPLLLTAACFDDLLTTKIHITNKADFQVKVPFTINGSCTDHQTVTDEFGTTTWDETPTVVDGVLQQCTIDAQWDGDPIKLAKMHQDTADECAGDKGPTDKCDPDTLDLSMSFTINGASFVAGTETLMRDQLVDLTVRATTGDATMFEFDKSTPLPLALAADPGVKAQLQTAYLAAGSLPVTAVTHIVLSGNDVRRLQESSPQGTLVVDLSSMLDGAIDVHP